MTLLDGAAATEIHRRGRRPSPLAMRLEEDFNILIEALFIFFDRPEIIPMRLHDLRVEGTAVKHGISTDHHPAQIDLTQQAGSKGYFTGSQLGPMSHRATTILPCQFCQHPDHE